MYPCKYQIFNSFWVMSERRNYLRFCEEREGNQRRFWGRVRDFNETRDFRFSSSSRSECSASIDMSARPITTNRVLPTCVQCHNSLTITRSSSDVPHAISTQLRQSNETHSVFVPVLRNEIWRVAAGNSCRATLGPAIRIVGIGSPASAGKVSDMEITLTPKRLPTSMSQG